MYDKSEQLDPAGPPEPAPLAGFSIEGLLALRAQIDERLPATQLKDLDLETELVIQFQVVKTLQTRVMDDKTTPSNQRAQVANSCASTLQQLTKMQAEFYTSERFKAIESALIKLLRKWPEGEVETFFDEYETLH